MLVSLVNVNYLADNQYLLLCYTFNNNNNNDTWSGGNSVKYSIYRRDKISYTVCIVTSHIQGRATCALVLVSPHQSHKVTL